MAEARTNAPPDIRSFHSDDTAALARLWHAGWHEAHAAHVPARLRAARTLAFYHRRLAAFAEHLRIIGPVGAPEGLCMTRKDEVFQLFVTPEARGTGIATALLTDAEAKLAAQGATTGHLSCLPTNTRAIAFYRRQGWQPGGIEARPLQTGEGHVMVDMLSFRKHLE